MLDLKKKLKIAKELLKNTLSESKEKEKEMNILINTHIHLDQHQLLLQKEKEKIRKSERDRALLQKKEMQSELSHITKEEQKKIHENYIGQFEKIKAEIKKKDIDHMNEKSKILSIAATEVQDAVSNNSMQLTKQLTEELTKELTDRFTLQHAKKIEQLEQSHLNILESMKKKQNNFITKNQHAEILQKSKSENNSSVTASVTASVTGKYSKRRSEQM